VARSDSASPLHRGDAGAALAGEKKPQVRRSPPLRGPSPASFRRCPVMDTYTFGFSFRLMRSCSLFTSFNTRATRFRSIAI
jgi:hypothetical protein